MLKCIILDGDIATLNELMEYLEQVNRSLTEVNSLFATNKLSNQSIFLRDGNRIVRINQEDILYLEGYGDYVKVHRAEGKPILSQLTLKHFEECLEGVFVAYTVPILFHCLISTTSNIKESALKEPPFRSVILICLY